jgi:uncharacterized protein involved in response to NO
MIHIEEPARPASPTFPLWRLGFRPFYLAGAAFAALAIPLWLAIYSGAVHTTGQVSLYWHMHEMVYGFALAILIGFLYTAARNWTGLPTPNGGGLAALLVLWLSGRLAMLLAAPWLAAWIDLLFLPCATLPLYLVLKRADNRRNLFLIALLSLLTVFNAAFHLSVLQIIASSPVIWIHAAILVIVCIESIIGARVIPMFTSNALGFAKIAATPLADKLCILTTAGAALAWLFALPSAVLVPACLCAALCQWLRLCRWQGQHTARHPLLWILHASFAWIPLGFVLLACAALHWISNSAAFHAFTVGSMAGLMMGMITRTALGHTGRKLLAGKAELCMFVLIQVAAGVRLLAALAGAALYLPALVLSASCWTLAFAVYLRVYGAYLCSARVDGRDG